MVTWQEIAFLPRSLFFLFWVLKRNPSLNEIFLYSYMKDVCLSEPVLCLKQFHQLSSMSQAWTRQLLWSGLILLDWSNTIMNFVWHFLYLASCPFAQTSVKYSPEDYRFYIHAYESWISVTIQQNQFGCLQESTVWANCPGFLLLPEVKQVF